MPLENDKNLFRYAATALVHDMRYAARSLLRSAGFSTVAVLTLALGIGAATALFTIVNSVLLRPLPYADADRVVSLWTRFLPESGYDFPQFTLSGPELLDVRAQARTLEHVAAYTRGGALLATGDSTGEPVRLQQAFGTANLFDALGVSAALGRTFLPDDDRVGAPCVVVLSHRLWLDAFGGDPSVVGTEARLDNTPCAITGVMPAGFAFPDEQARLWRNFVVDPARSPWLGRASHNLTAIGRLAPDATLAQAEAEIATLMAGWREQYPDHHTGHFVYLRSFLDDVVGNVRPELTMLLAAAGLVLVIICANLASLLLARGEGRRRELGVRLALGGGRGRLAVHLLAESFALAIAGGVLGVTFAVGLLDGLLALYPGNLPRAGTIAVDWRVFGFAVLATGLCALLFGLLPALRLASTAPAASLRMQARGAAPGRTRLMGGLVVAEVALSVTLVTGAGLLLRSYENIRAVDLGLEADGVYAVAQALPGNAYPTPESVRAFYSSLLEKLAALPGVQSVGAVTALPLLGGAGAMDDFIIEGRPEPGAGEPQLNAGYVLATPGYFESLGVTVVSGRAFAASDQRESEWVAVVNEETARRYWPDADPLGRRLRYRTADPNAAPQWLTIVGVVANTRVNGAQGEPSPQVFVPHAQMPREQYPGRFMNIVVRTAGDPLAVAPAVRTVMTEADRSLPIIGGRAMTDIVSDSAGQPRFASLLATSFAVVALLLGALGTHGVLSYAVAQREGELGVRLALGARPRALLRLVVSQGMRLTCCGVALGLAGSYGAARLLGGLLFGVEPLDALSYGGAVVVLGTAAFLACYGPARRAARVDPMTALRAE